MEENVPERAAAANVAQEETVANANDKIAEVVEKVEKISGAESLSKVEKVANQMAKEKHIAAPEVHVAKPDHSAKVAGEAKHTAHIAAEHTGTGNGKHAHIAANHQGHTGSQKHAQAGKSNAQKKRNTEKKE